ncbi:hypothetical protein GCM10023192_52850 [Amycolatopsis samaneae]
MAVPRANGAASAPSPTVRPATLKIRFVRMTASLRTPFRGAGPLAEPEDPA